MSWNRPQEKGAQASWLHYCCCCPVAITAAWDRRRKSSGRRCAAGQTGFFTRLGRLIKEKAKSDVDKLFSGFSKTRESLSVVDELLLYWNLADTDRVLDELKEALLVSDFGPKISFKIVDSLREDILAGKLKSRSEIKEALKTSVLQLLTSKGSKTELQLGFRKPAVIMIVGVNGGGKTTSLGNHFDLVCSLAHFPFMLSP
ncbi:hypothetical protein ZIOFF_002018 [Zingiber officinale]|uniref:Signal recognition particle SRP54 helical bundle domain-containing protein n=1 Tax=Zingiber officinale TaxID=94328 RepID=A0A8J5M8B3_ZINOF|nr:hypothetical protein ZIOFF_002018 [Zingiber officinale]